MPENGIRNDEAMRLAQETGLKFDKCITVDVNAHVAEG